MELTFVQPAPQLARYVTTYYLFEEGYTLIEDRQRADIGSLRFFLEGSGFHRFRGGRRAPSHPVSLNGPTNASNVFTVAGPLRFIGIPLLPQAWGGLVRRDANALADDSIDGTQAFSRAPDLLIQRLSSCTTVAEMAPLLDAWLLPQLKPIPDDHKQAIDRIRHWLSDSIFPDITTLYAQFSVTDRQVMRIANRYYGAPPKLLARKYGALKTASHLFQNNGAVPDEAVAHYADRSHLIRDIKQFTGQTPSELRTISSRIMRATLSAENFRELMPPA
jgi:AraC-like DNA-binding protein